MICLSEIKHKYLKKTKILETSGYWRYLCFDIEDLIQSNGHTGTQPKLVSSSGFKLIQHWYFQSHARRAGSIPKNLSLYSAPIFLPHWFPHKCLSSLSYYPPASVTALWYYTLGHKNISASETSRSRVSSVILLVKILTQVQVPFLISLYISAFSTHNVGYFTLEKNSKWRYAQNTLLD